MTQWCGSRAAFRRGQLPAPGRHFQFFIHKVQFASRSFAAPFLGHDGGHLPRLLSRVGDSTLPLPWHLRMAGQIAILYDEAATQAGARPEVRRDKSGEAEAGHDSTRVAIPG